MGFRALSQHKNLILSALSSAGIGLALCAFLCAVRPCQAQQKASTSFQQVEVLMQQGHLDEAKAAVLQQLQRDPGSVEGYNLLGIIESDQRDYANAATAFQKAIQLAPNSTKSHVNLGNFYISQNKIDLAEKEFQTALRLEPNNQDANYDMGILLIARGSPANAIPHLQRVRPVTVAVQISLIRAYLQTKRTAEALAMAAKLSSENKNNVQVHFSLGTLLGSERQFKPAVLELQQADALQPGTFEILFNLGQVFLRDGQFPKADLALSRALKLKPDSPETLYLMAQVCADDARPLDALDFLVRAHKIAPDNTDIIFLMAQVSISQNYFEDAIPLLESGLKLAPQRSDLRAALGESYFMAGKVDKAIDEFKQLIAVEPSARSYAFLGLSYRHLGRFDEAKQYFQQGLKLDPHNSSCIFNLGFIAERQGDAAGAETMFQEALRYNPNDPDALLELANLRVASKKFSEAETLLKRYVQVSRDPATGYYKLAMVERSLHETAAADRDLSVFQTLSKDAPAGPYPYEHLFDYLDSRAKLAPGARDQLDLTELTEQIKKHPDQPEDLYLLAEAYLKSGKSEEAKDAIAQLDKLSAGDYRTLTGVGVLLARYHLYDDAIQHFQAARAANPGSDEVAFDLANAYFHKGLYPQALDTAGEVSEQGRKDDAYLALLGDIYAHMGDTARAEEIYRGAISRNPDNDQDYLSLALLEFRENNLAGAKDTLLKGQARIPGSVLEGDTREAADRFERAVDLLPEWPGSYSTLGVFYFETGQIERAKEVLHRFKNSSVSGGLDVKRIEQVLAQAQATSSTGNEPLTMANRTQLLQLALALADRTL
jgi:tetratricopeptide (TPR) repeat protein